MREWNISTRDRLYRHERSHIRSRPLLASIKPACNCRHHGEANTAPCANAMSVLQQDDSNAREKIDEVADQAPMSAGDPIAVAAVASVLFAWYNFYIRGEKQTGIFVGLWAPTMLAAASYLQQKDIIRKFKQGLASF